MIGSAVSGVMGGIISFVTMLFSLLPHVNIEDLPIGVPSSVSGVLSVLNLFCPIGDMLFILSIWIFALILFNMISIFSEVLEKFL